VIGIGLRFSLRSIQRDWRAGELRVIAISLMLAVTAVTTVGFFTDRVGRAMTRQASELLAGDLVISSPDPIRREITQQANIVGLARARTLSFPSVVLRGDTTLLTEVKAVSPGYPLRGRLRTAEKLYGEATTTDNIPAPGSVWVEPRLLTQLSMQVGDQLQLGRLAFKVSHVLAYEPDRGSNLFQFAPRVMLNEADLEATGLVVPASRVSHQLLLAGDQNQVEYFSRWMRNHTLPGERLLGIEDGRPEMRTALERAQQFLGLAALVSVLLGGSAIAVATRHYAKRQSDNGAIMRCMGASSALLLQMFLLRLLWLGTLASLIGSGLGFLAQEILSHLLAQWFVLELPAASLWPLVSGMVTGLVVLTGFALPPLLHLRRVPPLRVLRRDLALSSPSVWSVALVTLLVMLGLMWWQTGDVKLAAMVGGGAVATIALLWLAATGLITTLKRTEVSSGMLWRFGLAALTRRSGGSTIQIVAIGLGIMALLLLTLVRVDVLQAWGRTLPPETPNQFLVNIQPHEVEPLRQLFQQQNRPPPILYPMVRGRLVGINDTAVGPDHFQNERAQRLVSREFNLSWTTHIQEDNRVTAGRWWTTKQPAAAEFSLEQGVAKSLGLKLGDRLRFRATGKEFEAKVTSLRSVKWDSFNVNFFVIATPGVLEKYPATYVTSFYLGADQSDFLIQLVRQFPSITVLDVRSFMDQVRKVIEHASLAIEYVFMFTLLAGLMVLYAAIQSTLDERRKESAILRTLGAMRQQIMFGITLEFVVLGALAGLLAAIAASLLGYLLTTQIFELVYSLNPWIWLAGILSGAIGVGIAGVLGVSPTLNSPPIQVLRHTPTGK
jgi:putative ABC transport system permease protein